MVLQQANRIETVHAKYTDNEGRIAPVAQLLGRY